ncbi:MAG: endolytic transglycosylase MltG, partial [Candidatus Dormibacteraeota bacterium]|nr:endolytic transglycosylase MltG [Candidatus Dormibacteraeota bacterium]
MRKLIVFLVVIGGIVFGANSAYGWYQRETDLPAAAQPEAVTFKVTTGESSAEIADDLYSKGLIRNREVFQLYVRLNNLAPTFQAGEYALDKHMTMRQVTEALQHSHVDQFSFTIPEGYTIGRTAKKWEAENHGTAQSYIDAANPANWSSFDFVAQRPKVAGRPDNLEGYLLPETYSLNKSATARDLVKAQLEQFQKLLTPQLKSGIQGQNQTVDKIVILASMVDREVQTDPNRAIVCGIYYNRLALP